MGSSCRGLAGLENRRGDIGPFGGGYESLLCFWISEYSPPIGRFRLPRRSGRAG